MSTYLRQHHTTAHEIRNTQTQMSRAVCALKATARWAVTGTPIQNRSGDLAALFKFIRAYPYDDARKFDSDIGQMWKTGNIDEAVARLRRLSRGLILRRPKTVIELPPRTDLKFAVEFQPAERVLYDKIKHQTITRIEEAFEDGDRGGLGSNSYITVMQRINGLRMICDLGLGYDDRHDLRGAEEARDPHPQDWSTIAQETFNMHREVTSVVCVRCTSPCNISATPLLPESVPQSYFAECLSYICADCAQRCCHEGQAISCAHPQNHGIAAVSTTWAAIEESSASGVNSACGRGRSARLSSKVTTLVSHLNALPPDTKRLVVTYAFRICQKQTIDVKTRKQRCILKLADDA